MDEDQQYERFDVDNDFEGFTTYGTEAFFSRKKQKRVQDEDDRLYGVFQGDSDSEGEGRKRRKGPREKDDYAKPVAFVSTGLGNEGSDARDSDKALLAETKTIPATTPSGLGFKPAKAAAESDEEEEEEGVLPTAFGKRCGPVELPLAGPQAVAGTCMSWLSLHGHMSPASLGYPARAR